MDDRLRISADRIVKQCMGIRKDETVLVLTDEPEFLIGQAIFDAAKEVAQEVFFLEMLPRSQHGEEPPSQVADMMKKVNVVIAPTFKSLTFTQARFEACQSGARVATLPGILQETFIRAINTDYTRVADTSRKLAKMLTDANIVRVTSDKGTDLIIPIQGKFGHADTGIFHRVGDFGNLPAGEAYIAPVEGKVGGKVVVDGAVEDSGILSKDDYVTIEFENGLVCSINGGRTASYLSGVLAQYPDSVRNMIELGIGTNPSAKLCGNNLEDEKVLGTIHIVIGDELELSKNTKMPVRIDMVVVAPNLYLDGKLIMDNGKLKI